MKFFVAIFVIFSLSSISFAEEIESIIGVTFDFEGIEYQVRSNGCTRKLDFTVELQATHPERVGLRLVRIKPDVCKMTAFHPYGTTIKFTWQELFLVHATEVNIMNPWSNIRVYRRP